MTDLEKVEFIIRYLGFTGACATLRATKDRLKTYRAGSPLLPSANNKARKTIEEINKILNGYSAAAYIEEYFYAAKRLEANVKQIKKAYVLSDYPEAKTAGV